MDQEQTLPDAPDSSDTQEDGSLDAAALAFEQRKPAEAQADAPDAPDDAEAQSDDPDAEGNADSDEDTDAELEEITVEGVKLSLPKDQAEAIRKSTLRQSDYSRKSNELAQERQTVTERLKQAETLLSAVDKVAEAQAQAQVAQQALAQFQRIDWAALEREDPARASLMAVRAMQAQQQVQAATEAATRAKSEAQSIKDAEFQTRRNEMFEAIEKAIPGWTAETGSKLTGYALSQGMKFETLQTATDPAIVLLLDKARKYDALQEGKAALKAKVQDAPKVLKPGVPRQSSPKGDAMARLRKSNTVDDAAAAFAAMR